MYPRIKQTPNRIVNMLPRLPSLSLAESLSLRRPLGESLGLAAAAWQPVGTVHLEGFRTEIPCLLALSAALTVCCSDCLLHHVLWWCHAMMLHLCIALKLGGCFPGWVAWLPAVHRVDGPPEYCTHALFYSTGRSCPYDCMPVPLATSGTAHVSYCAVPQALSITVYCRTCSRSSFTRVDPLCCPKCRLPVPQHAHQPQLQRAPGHVNNRVSSGATKLQHLDFSRSVPDLKYAAFKAHGLTVKLAWRVSDTGNPACVDTFDMAGWAVL